MRAAGIRTVLAVLAASATLAAGLVVTTSQATLATAPTASFSVTAGPPRDIAIPVGRSDRTTASRASPSSGR